MIKIIARHQNKKFKVLDCVVPIVGAEHFIKGTGMITNIDNNKIRVAYENHKAEWYRLYILEQSADFRKAYRNESMKQITLG